MFDVREFSILGMSDTAYYFLTASLLLLGLPFAVLALTRGAQPHRKRLRLSLLLLGGLILLRSGGAFVLSVLHMGWRLHVRYTMNFLILVLFLVSVFLCLACFSRPEAKEPKPVLVWAGSVLSLLASAALITLLAFGLSFDTLHESTPSVNGQTVVKESKMNGGAVRRFYLPVNALVHGQELEYDWRTNVVTLPTGEKGNPV